MLRVVAICAVALGCHLIVAADSDLANDDNVANETIVEELSTLQSEREPRAKNEDAGQKEQSFCLTPPVIEGVISPDPERDEYPLGAVISYHCKFGYVSRSSGSLLSICREDMSTGKAEWTYPNTTCIPRSCGDPGYVVNARRIGNLFTFPNSVKFECLEGYKTQGLKDRYCQASGEWSGRLPTCIPIRCPVPPRPQNGRVRYSSLEYGSELQYECDKGFMLENYMPRICNGGGIWSNNEPECIETSCRTPEAPKHGSVQLSDKPKVGTLAFYTCDDGTTLVGASTSKCLTSGDWTFDPPKCLRSCYVSQLQDGQLGRFHRRTRNTKVFNSFKVGESVKHQEEVTFLCKDGYSPGNQTSGRTQEVQCNDGIWSEPLYCHPMECKGEPPSIENGSPRIGNRAHGSTIWYECDSGYKRTQNGKVECRYGKWEGPTPICSDYRCYMKDLNYPGLLKPQMDFINNGEHFNLACDTAYKISSSKKRVLCSKGIWDITRNPCILKICEEEPPSINNGIPKEFDRMNGSFVDYECEEGYEMVGKSSVYCALGIWVGQPPDCNLSTETVAKVSLELGNNSEIVTTSNPSLTPLEPEECFCTYQYHNDYLRVLWRGAEIQGHDKIKKGDNVLFECRHPGMDIVWPNGLRFFEKMRLICDRCQDWEVNDLPHCEVRVAGDSFILYNDEMQLRPGGVIEVPQSARFVLGCINPWTAPKWNAEKKLSYPEDPRHARQTRFFRNDIIIDKMDYEHVGRYECFAMNYDQKLRAAVVDLKIYDSDVSCPELATETKEGSFRILYSNERKVGSIARYTCKESLKKIVGSSEIRCLENGKWSQSYIACEDILCPPLKENNVFLINYSGNRKVNSLAFYRCLTGRQRLIGSSNRTCLHSGEWSGTNPQCEDITCPEFRTYNGLSVTYSRDRKVGSIASFNCIIHATLVGSPHASCQYNGTWSHPRPSCENYVSCDTFPTFPNLNVLYTDRGRIGSVATFQCLHPTSLVGSPTARCLSNGTWSHSLPICAAPNCTIEAFDNFLELRKLDALHANLMNITSDSLPPGSELPLTCEENSVLIGSLKAVCNSVGEWDIKDAQCISACRVNKDETSLLIVEPMKDYYRFAEFILLSCPPGQKLTTEVERMMCLGSAWSDTLPDCVETTEPNTSETAEITTKSD